MEKKISRCELIELFEKQLIDGGHYLHSSPNVYLHDDGSFRGYEIKDKVIDKITLEEVKLVINDLYKNGFYIYRQDRDDRYLIEYRVNKNIVNYGRPFVRVNGFID